MKRDDVRFRLKAIAYGHTERVGLCEVHCLSHSALPRYTVNGGNVLEEDAAVDAVIVTDREAWEQFHEAEKQEPILMLCEAEFGTYASDKEIIEGWERGDRFSVMWTSPYANSDLVDKNQLVAMCPNTVAVSLQYGPNGNDQTVVVHPISVQGYAEFQEMCGDFWRNHGQA